MIGKACGTHVHAFMGPDAFSEPFFCKAMGAQKLRKKGFGHGLFNGNYLRSNG